MIATGELDPWLFKCHFTVLEKSPILKCFKGAYLCNYMTTN